MVADGLPIKIAPSGHKLVPSLVSVPEKTFEDFQVVHPHSAPAGDRRLAADDQDSFVGVILVNESVLNVKAKPPWQDLNLVVCDPRETFTKVRIDPVLQHDVSADVLTNGAQDNYLTKWISVPVGLELPSDSFISDSSIVMDHVVDLESGVLAPPLAFDTIQSPVQSIDVMPCVDCANLHDGLLASVVNQVKSSDTWMDTMLCWLASGFFLQDFLLLSTWASQVFVCLANAKGIAWKAAAGLAQTFLVAPKWQLGKHPNSRKAQAPRRNQYCPGIEHQGDCFFACLAYAITGSPPTKAQVRSVRLATAALWRLAPQNLLDKTAVRAGFASADDYVCAIQDAAWGGLPDLLIWTQLLGLNANVAIDNELHTIGCGGLHLELADKHFVVTKSTPQCQWRRLTGIVSRKAQKIPLYLEQRVRRAPAPAQYHILARDGTDPSMEGIGSAHISSNSRGGMHRAPDPAQGDEERIDQRAHLASLRTQQPDAYVRALRTVCTAITQ
eukprot:4844014-Amphidinium_carterae.1